MLKGTRQCKSYQQSGIYSLINRLCPVLIQYQQAGIPHDKKLQGLVKELNTKTRFGYNKNEDPVWPQKLKVYYQQAVHLTF